jgi:hypothetical protein
VHNDHVGQPRRAATQVDWWIEKELGFYPQLRPKIAGVFVPSPPSPIPASLISRIKTSYRLAMASFRGAGDSPWSTYIDRARNIHESLLAADDHDITRILSDPIPTRLFYGFYSVTRDLDLDESSIASRPLADKAVRQVFDCMLRLAEATGAMRIWNPEGVNSLRYDDEYGTPTGLEALLKALETTIGTNLDFPNPFQREYGLPTTRGIASYRAPHAIYQAWRAQELLRHIGGKNVLEIGAGMGRTAYYAKRMGINDFTIVDLPLASVAQAAFLGQVLGPDAIWLPGDPVSKQAGRIRICPPEWLSTNDETFALVLNADSITEMDGKTAATYFREIARRTTLFLSINHEDYPTRTSELPSKCGIKAWVQRHPYWLRKGYVEELYYIETRNLLSKLQHFLGRVVAR